MVVLELSVDGASRQDLKLVSTAQMTLLYLVEIPCYKEPARGGHNACLMNCVSIVELGGSEVNISNLMLDNVLRVDGELQRLGFGL